MSPALQALEMAIAAAGGDASFVPGGVTLLRSKSRDFAETIASDVYAHLQADKTTKQATDNITASDTDDAAKIKSLLPLVTKAAKSLFAIASSGDFKFDVIFPAAALQSITRHIVVHS